MSFIGTMIPRFLQLQGVTKRDRHDMISRVKDAIQRGGGYILDFQMFSNKAISISFETPAGNIGKLYSALKETNLSLDNESRELLMNCSKQVEQSDAKSQTTDVMGGLHITFIHDEPDLRIECPPIPG